jgi:flagellar protein FliS
LSTAYDTYLESTILLADPLELVAILYHAALDRVGSAKAALREGDILRRSREITGASEVLNELALSLDHEQGGDYSRTLAELYDYMQRRLIEANCRQVIEPLDEVSSLLLTLREGWESCRASLRPRPETPQYQGHHPIEAAAEYSPLSFTA